mgnify:CR=1 FL=1
MSEQANWVYEYGISNHRDYDRARVDQYMAAIVSSLVTTLPKHDSDAMLERCADLAVKAVKAVDDAMYETTP